jgi:hypothetical protein
MKGNAATWPLPFARLLSTLLRAFTRGNALAVLDIIDDAAALSRGLGARKESDSRSSLRQATGILLLMMTAQNDQNGDLYVSSGALKIQKQSFTLV